MNNFFIKIFCFSCVTFYLFAFAVFAQVSNKSAKIITINNKEYFVHTVLKGQSIYTIAKAYNVDEEDIFIANPKSKKKIKPNQVLNIPVKKKGIDEKNHNISVSEKFIIHTVVKGETLSKIAEENFVTVAEIKKLNPSLEPDKLSLGQQIKIPENNKNNKLIKVVKDSIPIITPKDTNIRVICDQPKLENTYNVALMIPLYLDNVYNISIGEKTSIKDLNNYKSFTFIQFYEGALLALDSMKKLGFSCNLFVYDVDEDTVETMKILKKPELEKMHLIIGPFFSKSLAIVAEYGKKRNINVVDPFSLDTIAMKKYSNVFKANPTYKTQIQFLSEFLTTQYKNENIILVHNEKESEHYTLVTIRQALTEAFSKQGITTSGFKEIIYSKSGIGGITSSFVPNKKNVVITLMTGELFITSYLSQFNNYKNKENIIIVGMPAWKNYDNIEVEYFNNLNVHLFSNSFIDYDDSKIKRFLTIYRDKYIADPDKLAFQGFDITLYFLTALKKYGMHFEDCISKLNVNPIQTNFNFKKVNQKSGFENNYVNIFRFENYKLVEAHKPFEKKKIK